MINETKANEKAVKVSDLKRKLRAMNKITA